MTNLFNRWLPCLTLTAWSAVLLYFAKAPQNAFWGALSAHTHLFSGRVDSFVVPAFRPYVLIAGFVMLAMALMFIFFPADAACCSAAECGHPLSRFKGGRWLTFLVLLIPISAAAFTSPDSFGKTVMLNRGVVMDASALAGRGAPTLPPAKPTLELPLPTNQPATAAQGTGSPAPKAEDQSAAPAPNDYL